MNDYRLYEIDMIAPAIGKIVLLWGFIEADLNSMAIALLSPRNNPPPNDGVPVSFRPKIDLLKRCYRDNPKMAPICEEAREQLIRLTPLHDRRSVIMHGYYQGRRVDDRHSFTAFHGGRAKRHSWRDHYFTNTDLAALANDIQKSVSALDPLNHRTRVLSIQ